MVNLKHKECDTRLEEVWVHTDGKPLFVISDVMYCATHGIIDLDGVEVD